MGFFRINPRVVAEVAIENAIITSQFSIKSRTSPFWKMGILGSILLIKD